MVTPALSRPDDDAVEALFGDELERAEQTREQIQPVLRHLLDNTDQAPFSDRVVAQVRAQLHDLAHRLVAALDEAAPREQVDAACAELVRAFAASPPLLGHVHALALETQLAERLAEVHALDPVLPPLLEALTASSDRDTAAQAQRLLAAQARFVQAQRRGELPPGELPGDLLHGVLAIMRAHCGGDEARDGRAAAAERAIRSDFDEAGSRFGLLHRVIGAMGAAATEALDVAHGGIALFVTALGVASGQDRDTAVLATCESQMPRLALALLASGLAPAAVERQLLTLHPDRFVPGSVDVLRADRAAALLAGARGVAER